MADSMAELFAQGMRLRIASDVERQQKVLRQQQAEKNIRERLAYGKRSSPQYAEAWMRGTDPNTPLAEVGKWASIVGADDMEDFVKARNENQLAKTKLEEAMTDPGALGAMATGAGVPFGPGEAPGVPLRDSQANAVINARAAGQRKVLGEEGQDRRLGQREEGQDRRAGMADDTKRWQTLLRQGNFERRQGHVEKKDAAAQANAERRTNLMIQRFEDGRINTRKDVQAEMLKLMVDEEKYSTAEQQRRAHDAAEEAWEDYLAGGVDLPTATAAAVRRWEISAGDEGGEKPPAAKVKPAPAADPIGDLIRSNKWTDTPELRAKIRARQAFVGGAK